MVETKRSQIQIEKIRSRFGAKFCFSISLVRNKGGLALLWFEDIELEIINYSTFHIHTKVMENSLGVVSFLTSFYSAPEVGKRACTWNLLGRINSGMDANWCLMGDFNEIISHNEKIGGRPRPLSQMATFKYAIESNGLLDLGWKVQNLSSLVGIVMTHSPKNDLIKWWLIRVGCRFLEIRGGVSHH